MDEIRGHMTFDDIALHESGMTGIEFLRYLVCSFHIHELLARDILLLDCKTIGLQVPDPR